MRRIPSLLAVTAIVAACSPTPASQPAPAPAPDSVRVRSDIAWLADDAREGRGTGTAGNDSSAAWAARRYAALGLQPVAPGFLQPFVTHSAMMEHGAPLHTQNVVALLPGTDPALRGEALVVGAHIDHLGRSTVGALDPEAGDAIRNGADDNASGTAAVLELARLFAAHPLRRSLLFVNFSGEELGLLGSQYFVEHSPVPLDSIVAMINFDMVGRLRDRLIVYGVETATEFRSLLDSANAGVGVTVDAVGDGYGPSDQSSFYAKGIPVLHFFTDLHDDYHRATDDIERINAGGEARVIALAERVLRAIDARDGRLTFIRVAAPPPMASGSGSQVYLGTVPDMAGDDGRGLRITGVRAGSPADSSGLKAGDIVVQLGGKAVTDLQSYADALYAHQPGDVVDIVVLRGTQRVTVRATLGKRG